MAGRKAKINFVLRDLRDNMLHCTLWEGYTTQYFEFKYKQVDPSAPTVIILKYANVKEEGKFRLSVTNVYNVSKIHINEDVLEISDFLQCLPKDPQMGKSRNNTSKSTHDYSQKSSRYYLSLTDKLFSKVVHLPLDEITLLTKPTLWMDTQLRQRNEGLRL
ncbi:unnamed protein product [Vicia faba]|uniref:Uncharacterized protein n=1 Tax=Vicia faba TaxID=3906 RepID=A0AAV0ZN66_VICFA|nr:unnamed protein product [Vicia faba]